MNRPLSAVTVYLPPHVIDVINKQAMAAGEHTHIFLEKKIETIFISKDFIRQQIDYFSFELMQLDRIKRLCEDDDGDYSNVLEKLNTEKNRLDEALLYYCNLYCNIK